MAMRIATGPDVGGDQVLLNLLLVDFGDLASRNEFGAKGCRSLTCSPGAG